MAANQTESSERHEKLRDSLIEILEGDKSWQKGRPLRRSRRTARSGTRKIVLHFPATQGVFFSRNRYGFFQKRPHASRLILDRLFPL